MKVSHDYFDLISLTTSCAVVIARAVKDKDVQEVPVLVRCA